MQRKKITCMHGMLKVPALTEKRKTLGKPRTKSMLSGPNLQDRSKVLAPVKGRPVSTLSCACRVTINMAMSSNERNTEACPIGGFQRAPIHRKVIEKRSVSTQALVIKGEPRALTVSN